MQSKAGNYRSAFAIVTALFFMWGFITVMNDVLINTFEGIFDLTAVQASLVQLSFFGAFFIISLLYMTASSITGKDPINRIGYKTGMAVSLIICGLGCLGFYFAAEAHSYDLFLTALFILATGVTLLQICANPYVALLGDPDGASGRLNLSQGLNSLGTTLGPLVGVLLIFRVFSSGQATAGSVGKTYMVYGGIFLLAALMIFLVNLPTFKNTEKIKPGLSVLKYRHLALGILAIFFYVGAEVSEGSWLVKLLQDPNVGKLPKEDANYFLSYYWGGLMIGRLMGTISLGRKSRLKKNLYMAITSLALFGFIYFITSIKKESGAFFLDFLRFREVSLFMIFLLVNYIGFVLGGSKASRSLLVFSLVAIVLLMLVVFSHGQISFWSAVSLGLFNSIMWSNIFTLAIRDLGKYTSQGSSLLVMAIVGGAVIPRIQGYVIDHYGVQISYLVPVLSYVYLAFYGWKGYKPIKTISE